MAEDSLLLGYSRQAAKSFTVLWETVLAIEDEASVQSFLRHCWLSQYGEIKTHALYREIKPHIETDNVESLGFSRDLGKAVALYYERRDGNRN